MNPHAGQSVLTRGAPLGQSDRVMIMLHGRNAGPQNILDLVPLLGRPAWTYLAPAAAGGTWYPYSFMVERERNESYLSSALNAIGTLVADVEVRGINASHVVLLGFSQGACLTAEFANRYARRYGGVVAYSGGLIGPPGTTWTDPAGAFDRTPIFLGCSDVDPHVPKSRVDESAAVFSRMDAAVTKRIYQGMGHTVNDDEIAAAQAIMDSI